MSFHSEGEGRPKNQSTAFSIKVDALKTFVKVPMQLIPYLHKDYHLKICFYEFQRSGNANLEVIDFYSVVVELQARKQHC